MFQAIFQALFTYRPVVFEQGEFRFDPSAGSFAAAALGVPAEEVYVASTGVIGARLPMGKVEAGIRAAARVLEIRFSQPIDRFRTLQVDLLEGVLGTDQQPLAPWTLTFTTGGL